MAPDTHVYICVFSHIYIFSYANINLVFSTIQILLLDMIIYDLQYFLVVISWGKFQKMSSHIYSIKTTPYIHFFNPTFKCRLTILTILLKVRDACCESTLAKV